MKTTFACPPGDEDRIGSDHHGHDPTHKTTEKAPCPSTVESCTNSYFILSYEPRISLSTRHTVWQSGTGSFPSALRWTLLLRQTNPLLLTIEDSKEGANRAHSKSVCVLCTDNQRPRKVHSNRVAPSRAVKA